MMPATVPEMARALRRERTRRGYRLADAATRAGLPEPLLEALESGTVDRLPDGIPVVKALRMYADSLGFPGERFAMVLVDAWPAFGQAPLSPVVTLHSTPGPAPAKEAPPAPVTAPAGAAATAAVDLRAGGRTAPDQTATGVLSAVPAAAGVATAAKGREGPDLSVSSAGSTVRRVGGTSVEDTGSHTAQVPVFADTGVTPVSTSARGAGDPPVLLRALIIVVAILLLFGVAGLVVHQLRPQWFHDVGLGGSSPATSAAAPPRHHPAAPRSVFTLDGTSPTSATFTVNEPSFSVVVDAVGNASWVQATEPSQATPAYAGVLQNGQSQTFTVTQSLHLQVGSVAAHVFIKSGSQLLGFYFPPAAPFTLVFQTG